MLRHNGEERRHFVRIPFWFVTKYRLYPYGSGSPADFREGTGKNISSGGICFETEDNFKTNDILEIELDMPALSHAMRVIGKIVWSKTQKKADKKNIYGFAFTKIKPEDTDALKKIVDTFS